MMNRTKSIVLLATALMMAVLVSTPVYGSGSNDDNGNSNEFEMFTRLTGPLLIKARAKYEEELNSSRTRRDLKVKVEYAAPFTIFPVHINGQFLGMITTNAIGEGKIRLKDDAAPQLQTGTIVTVGPMTGVLLDRQDSSSRFYTKARLRGATSMKGTAKYIERNKRGGVRRTFSVEVKFAPPHKTFYVRVNGNRVGRLRTNSLGRGELQLRTAAFIDSPDDGDPMPDSFQAIMPGDVITLKTLRGVAFVKN